MPVPRLASPALVGLALAGAAVWKARASSEISKAPDPPSGLVSPAIARPEEPTATKAPDAVKSAAPEAPSAAPSAKPTAATPAPAPRPTEKSPRSVQETPPPKSGPRKLGDIGLQQ